MVELADVVPEAHVADEGDSMGPRLRGGDGTNSFAAALIHSLTAQHAYSILAPDSRTTLPHFSRSLRI